MAHKFNVVVFANLVGSVNFDNDEAYDNNDGWVELTDGSSGYVYYAPFMGAYERNVEIQNMLLEAAKVMGKWAELQKGF